jgi:hypothetical protein
MQELETKLPALQAQLGPLETLRLATLAKRNRALAAMLVAAPLAALVVLALAQQGPLPAIGAGLVAAIALVTTYVTQISSPFETYRQQFKQQFIARLLSTLTEDVRYFPEGDRAILEEYRRSELFPQEPDREHVEDTVFARLGATDLALAELHTEYEEVSHDKDGKRDSKWHTIFRGLFVSADFHKDFRGQTFVRSDVAEKYFGQFARFVQKPLFSRLELVQLEDPEFEQEFVVHSSDQIEARYILTPAMMQRMLELKRKFAAQVEFALLHSRVYVAISKDKDFFEPQLGQSLGDATALRGFLAQVQLCLGIVEDLDLNTRLWSK